MYPAMTLKTRGEETQYIDAQPIYKTYGIPGTNLLSGYVSGKEQNPQLTGRNWVLTAEDMLATDPIVKRSWAVVKQTLLSAKWIFKAGDDSDVAEELARFANECFGFDGYSGMMDISWEEQLGYLLEFIPQGWRYAEEIYCVEKDSIGQEKVFLKRYADREPSSHQRWLSADGRNLDGVIQNMVGGVQPQPIPASKLLLLTLNKTGSNFEGIGLLRPCWWWWSQKQRTANLLSVGVERWAIPTPVVAVDREVAERSGFTDGQLSEMINEAVRQAQSYIAQEQSYLVENTAVKFSAFGSQAGFNPDGALKVIQECDNQISQAFMAQFLNLGISDTGARSVGEVHLSVFRRACINFLDLVASAISGQDRAGGGTIGRLINFNYGKIESSKLPRLVHTGLDNDELTDALNSLPSLVQSQLLTPDDNLERAIRQRIGAGELPIEAVRTSQDRQVAQNPSLAMAERLRSLRDE
jgi:hypothetical protein